MHKNALESVPGTFPASRAIAACAALALAIMLAPPAPAQDINQDQNSRQLLDLSTITGPDPFQNLTGDIKTVCAGLSGGGGTHAASSQLQVDCDTVIGAALGNPSDPNVANAVEQIANDELASQGTVGVENSQLQARNVAARIAQVQTGVSAPRLTLADFGLTSLAPRTFSLSLDAAGDGGIGAGFSKASLFVNGSYYSGDQDQNAYEKGFGWDSYSLTAGMDYRFTDDFFAGVSAGYTNTDGDFDANGGKQKSDNFTFSVYGSYYTQNGFYLDGSLGYGRTNYDTDRNVIYQIPGADVSQTARSSTDGDEVSGSLSTGFNIQRGASTFTPHARLDYQKINVDGYDEVMCTRATGNCRTPADTHFVPGWGWALAMGDQDIKSLRGTLGASWQMAMNRDWGVFLPNATIDYVHEFKDDPRSVAFCFIDDVLCPGSAGVASSADPFVIRTAAPDQDFLMISGGFVAQFPGGKAAFLNIQHMAANRDVKQTGVVAGLRIEF